MYAEPMTTNPAPATAHDFAVAELAAQFGIEGIAAELLANALVRTVESGATTDEDLIDTLLSETRAAAKGLDRMAYNLQTIPGAAVSLAREVDLYGQLRAS